MKNYLINPDIFAKMSTRFAEIRKTKPLNYKVKELIQTDIFDIFVDACQLKNFDINKKNAFQLLDLAQEWGVASLQKYVNDYVTKKELVRKDIDDYVGLLLQHIADKTDNYTDWSNVGHILQDVIDDPRLLEVPPEIFTRILTVAEHCGFELLKENRLKLIDFTLRLLEVHPESAVPVVLRLDFSLLTPEQLRKIYLCKQLHEQNIGFFLESALSALVGKINVNIEKTKLINTQCLQSVLIDHKNKINQQTEKINKVFDRQVDDILDEIDRQQDILNDLHPHIASYIEKIDTAERKTKPKQLIVSDEYADKAYRDTGIALRKITEEVNEKLEEHLKALKDRNKIVSKLTEEYFQNCAKESTNDYEVKKFAADDLIKFGEQIGEYADEVEEEIKDVRSFIAAKIVRDKLRFDQFLRRTTGKYKVFEEEPLLWGLGQARVKEADKKIQLMERQLDELCPTRDQSK